MLRHLTNITWGTAPSPWAIVPDVPESITPVPVQVIIENPAVVFTCLFPAGLLLTSLNDATVPPLAFQHQLTVNTPLLVAVSIWEELSKVNPSESNELKSTSPLLL